MNRTEEDWEGWCSINHLEASFPVPLTLNLSSFSHLKSLSFLSFPLSLLGSLNSHSLGIASQHLPGFTLPVAASSGWKLPLVPCYCRTKCRHLRLEWWFSREWPHGSGLLFLQLLSIPSFTLFLHFCFSWNSTVNSRLPQSFTPHT